MPVQNSYPFHENGYQGRQPTRGGRRGGLEGRGYNRPQEEVPRYYALHEDNFFEDYEENPNVGQAYYGGGYGGQQGDKALGKIKWNVSSFMGDVVSIGILLKTRILPLDHYEDMCHLATKNENQRKKSGFSKATLPSSRNAVPKPKTIMYKSWAKKDKTPKMAFKDNFKLKVEEKSRLITNLTRCFKCNGVGHIVINCPIKRTLVLKI
ncbi:hypothetical protein M9H77_36423 [Catharanthus roseus]|uniref:Uncharacterized protein n=1 Tax=Catharanthus roseus TaxID=4058 RepID=A0ACB9ZS51_CATRO|nr:hypothetical protein M9H77_36423 [Catharanthus roseus]